jgi:hypothetical protein
VTLELLDRTLPAQLRALATDLDSLLTHARAIFADLAPPAPDSPLGVAHAFAAEFDRRVTAYRSWVESDSFPAAARAHRADFRAAADHLAASARRLAAATETRRVDELIERASEALTQGSLYLNAAMAGVLGDMAVELQRLGAPAPLARNPAAAAAVPDGRSRTVRAGQVSIISHGVVTVAGSLRAA